MNCRESNQKESCYVLEKSRNQIARGKNTHFGDVPMSCLQVVKRNPILSIPSILIYVIVVLILHNNSTFESSHQSTQNDFERASRIYAFGFGENQTISNNFPQQGDRRDTDSVQDRTVSNNGLNFFFIFTTSENETIGEVSKTNATYVLMNGSFTERHMKSIESVLHHHPTANVEVYSNMLPSNQFGKLQKLGYSVKVTRYSLQKLCRGLPATKWLDRLWWWKKGDYFYSHLTDLLRLVILYRRGGVYLDCDMILLKPLGSMSNAIGLQRSSLFSGPYAVNGAFLKFEKGDEFLLQCITEFVNTYRRDVWAWNGPGLLTRVVRRATLKTQNETSEASERVYSLEGTEFTLYPRDTFYPISRRGRFSCFDENSKKLLGKMVDSYAIHLNGKLTAGRIADEHSLCGQALNKFCIIC